MEIEETESFNLIEGEDENGRWEIRINKRKYICQLTIESHDSNFKGLYDNYSYINLDKKELFLIRELIDKQLLNM